MSDDLIERLRLAVSSHLDGRTAMLKCEPCLRHMADAADALDAYRKATGGLPPALVARAMHLYRVHLGLEKSLAASGIPLDHEIIEAIATATFEAPE